jgi:hypothetical protein
MLSTLSTEIPYNAQHKGNSYLYESQVVGNKNELNIYVCRVQGALHLSALVFFFFFRAHQHFALDAPQP